MKITMDNTANERWKEEIPPEDVAECLQWVREQLQKELNLCMTYLIYRVERDLYETILEQGIPGDFSWESLLSDLKWNEPLRSASAIVLSQGIFMLTESDYTDRLGEDCTADFLEDEEGDMLHCIRLFPDEIGRALLRILILRGQAFRYARQVEEGKEQSWTQFLDELNTNADLWNGLFRSLLNALGHLNFKPIWMNWDLENLLFDE